MECECPRCGRKVHSYDLVLVRDEADEICKSCVAFGK